MYELTLSPEEIRDVTRYRRYTKQQEKLRQHGIPFEVGPNNEPIVLRGNIPQPLTPLPKLSEYVSPKPDFGALDNGKTTQE
ncbi:DUF4224 domain-containing protein [Klebsiella aerogenes]|uniref:DUF4224 domain-containing protein n=1 Tax=Klebsiella aerogenes TaxID=548 RepID=UPI001BCD877A|nr:DUF4224 domain-containing protein [Klebsiella aerogenes]